MLNYGDVFVGSCIFGRPEPSSSPKLLRPRLNSAAQNVTVVNDGAVENLCEKYSLVDVVDSLLDVVDSEVDVVDSLVDDVGSVVDVVDSVVDVVGYAVDVVNSVVGGYVVISITVFTQYKRISFTRLKTCM